MQTVIAVQTLSRQQVVAKARAILAATKKNTMAYQHNLLVRHPLRLSTLEARIFVLALRCVTQTDKEFQGGFVVPLDELFPAGSSGERYEALEEAFKALLSKHFKLERPDSGDGSYIYTQLVSHVGLETGAGRIVGAFAPEIAPFLYQLTSGGANGKGGNFTTANIETLLTFKNATAQRLYWLLRSWASLGKKEISVDELKTLLFEGTDTYETYADFKRYVLKPCLLEVQKYGGWDVTYKEVKDGRKVANLVFHIPRVAPETKEAKATLPLDATTSRAVNWDSLTDEQLRVATRLRKLLLKDNQIQDVLNFIGTDKDMQARVMKSTHPTLRDYEAKNPSHVPQDKLAAATVNILKAELGIWK